MYTEQSIHKKTWQTFSVQKSKNNSRWGKQIFNKDISNILPHPHKTLKKHVLPSTQTHYPDSEETSLCSKINLLCILQPVYICIILFPSYQNNCIDGVIVCSPWVMWIMGLIPSYVMSNQRLMVIGFTIRHYQISFTSVGNQWR
jgi:hypothetical protein